MPAPTCRYCDRPAEHQCPRCGRVYCASHGDDVCQRCLTPRAATPRVAAYRGSLAVLVLATAAVIYLAVRPPESKSSEDAVRTVATATPTTAISATATPTQQGAAPNITRTPTPTAVPTTPVPSTVAKPNIYTVKANDTLSGIADQVGVKLADLLAANPGVTPANLQIGTELKIP
jgi:LysM repeat protein